MINKNNLKSCFLLFFFSIFDYFRHVCQHHFVHPATSTIPDVANILLKEKNFGLLKSTEYHKKILLIL